MKIQSFVDMMILSASGWRGIFAESGDAEDSKAGILPEAVAVAKLVAQNAVHMLRGHLRLADGDELKLIVGCDSRPTGAALQAAIEAELGRLGCCIYKLGVCSGPEIMAYCSSVSQEEGVHAFIYITASHNPVGYNGFKIGLPSGVIGGELSVQMIEHFRSLVAAYDDADAAADAAEPASNIDPSGNNSTTGSTAGDAAHVIPATFDAQDAYERSILRVAAKSDDYEAQEAWREHIKFVTYDNPLQLVFECNGSARGSGIDGDFLESLGIEVHAYHTEPGEIVHGIVPEGKNLDLCRRLVEEAYAQNPIDTIGYVPDCDGDRGNLVYYDKTTGKGEILEAQEVFAIVALSELMTARRHYEARLEEARLYGGVHPGELKLALAVNGPTSDRIDRIAALAEASVLRGEVGEANMLETAAYYREQGYYIPVLGEGSNGGNIAYPCTMRDPLNTITALLRLIRDPDLAAFELWCQLSGVAMTNFDAKLPEVSDILAALPVYTTTGLASPEAGLTIKEPSHLKLKQRYLQALKRHWDAGSIPCLAELGIESYEILTTRRSHAATQASDQACLPAFDGDDGCGGLSIRFKNKNNECVARLWMRGSQTEPVFRVLADIAGDNQEAHNKLLAWHREILQGVDA